MSRNLQSQATERDRCLKQINSKKKMGRKKRMSKASCIYSRKKKEDEMVTARQFEVNECKSITTALEGKDHGTHKGKS